MICNDFIDYDKSFFCTIVVSCGGGAYVINVSYFCYISNEDQNMR